MSSGDFSRVCSQQRFFIHTSLLDISGFTVIINCIRIYGLGCVLTSARKYKDKDSQCDPRQGIKPHKNISN